MIMLSFFLETEVQTEFSVENFFSALSYRISAKFAAKRNLFLKKDASNDCSMIVANVPPFISTVRMLMG